MSALQGPVATVNGIIRAIQPEELANPHCDTETWWLIAAEYPLDAMQSVLFPLLTLEAPERWQTMESAKMAQWVDTCIQWLSPSQEHAYAADCAEHVLPLWMEKEPKDKSPHEAIWHRRLYAMTIGSDSAPAFKARWEKAKLEAEGAAHGLHHRVSYGGSMGLDYAGEAALVAATEEIYWVVHKAAMAVGKRAVVLFVGSGYGGSRNPEQHQAHLMGKHGETRWQWERLQQYLRGEVP